MVEGAELEKLPGSLKSKTRASAGERRWVQTAAGEGSSPVARDAKGSRQSPAEPSQLSRCVPPRGAVTAAAGGPGAVPRCSLSRQPHRAARSAPSAWLSAWLQDSLAGRLTAKILSRALF